ncbi:hypothetical protein [Ktedonobacter racemifer]|uniref:Uncharacterized protein n=1 Tax=Ktedonobacter racemifer DSM 44963 TaxID=485913 RepID=D6U4S5_KTERA|nr:hypothetical protein [Ktedonobacter racemifer]EFH81505.1 hypothetical protein Krac_2231 [Ktedonobacter racemifer DSM 44963]
MGCRDRKQLLTYDVVIFQRLLPVYLPRFLTGLKRINLSGIYLQQVEFVPSATSMISFIVSPMANGQESPDTLLQQDLLVQRGKIERENKITINQLTWSTAIVDIPRSQVAAVKAEVAHFHPYRIAFNTPPEQFYTNERTMEAIFQTFQELQS